VRLELGGASSGGEKEKANSEPKEPASKNQSTSSDPEPSKKDEPKLNDETTPPPPSQEKRPELQKETPTPKQSEPKKMDSKLNTSAPAFGSRDERRVSSMLGFKSSLLIVCAGQDESYAPPYC
jgi:2-oxoglutarate dehydrogenase E2 component (dihydrolipoamide succinyltransferase)